MSDIILIPLLLIIALLVSVLGSVSGVGGGVLFVPILIIILPLNYLEQIKFLSTILVFTSALINVVFNIFKKTLNCQVVLLGLVCSLPTIFLGNYLVTLFDPRILKLIIGIILIFVGVLLILSEYVFNKGNFEKLSSTAYESHKWIQIKIGDNSYINIFKIIAISAVGGIVTSMTGMGGGPILMPILLIWCKLNMNKVAPISHSLIAGASLVSICTNYQFFANQELMINQTLPMLIGVLIGTTLAIFLKKYIKNEIYIKWILIILIFFSAVKMIIDAINQ